MGNKRGFLLTGAVCAATLAVAAASPACAVEAEDMRAALATEKAAQTRIEKEALSLNAEVKQLRARLVAASRSLRQKEENLSGSEEKLGNLRRMRQAYIEGLYKDEEALGGLLTAARRFNGATTPALLAQGGSPVGAARAALVMKTLIPLLDDRASALRTRIAEIDALAGKVKTVTAENEKELNEIKKENEKLNSLIEERKAVYVRTQNARKAQEDKVAQLAGAAKDLDDLVAKIRKTLPQKKPALAATAFRPPSNLLLPVHGRVETGFGEQDVMGAKSKGITLAARPGSAVVTPLAGRVKFAGPFQKFRQILIVEHQGGYHSLIAGLGRIDTVTGASLAAGEPVGIAHEESPVYYELRLNGAPVNPRKSTVAQRKQEKS